MASHKLPKHPPLIQRATGSIENTVLKIEDDGKLDNHLSGLASYLATASDRVFDRFTLRKMEDVSEAKRKVAAWLEAFFMAEADLAVAAFLRNHPDRKDWKAGPDPGRGGPYRRTRDKQIIRKAYDRFGCFVCKDKHASNYCCDQLCKKCYGRRMQQRMQAKLQLEIEERRAQKQRG